ncbi:MAG: Crp/Fnr family transcriptional regulator [Magnetococcus sp. DMHC-6]
MKSNQIDLFHTLPFRKALLFSALSEEQKHQVKKGMHLIELQKKETLFHEGDAAHAFYLLDRGIMKLYRLSAKGEEKIVRIIHPGEVFATPLMFLDSKTYPVTAEALKTSRIYLFDNKIFMDQMRSSPETAFKLLGIFSKRLQTLVSDIKTLCLQDASGRLIGYLLEKLPDNADAKSRIELEIPKQVLASHLSVQPESLSRILRSLNRKGLLSVHNKVIEIHDVQALRAALEACDPLQCRGC